MLKDHIDGDYRITEYENGTVVKQLISPEPELVEPVPISYTPTNAEIMENQLVLMDAIATLYEDLVLGGV